MIVTVACLIKARDEEVGSGGAVEQEVSGVTEPKTGDAKMEKRILVLFLSYHIHYYLRSRNLHLKASLKLANPKTESTVDFTSNILT